MHSKTGVPFVFRGQLNDLERSLMMLTVDPTSLNQAMADANYQFKSQIFRFSDPDLQDASVGVRFRSMLTSDPAHMMPHEKSAAVVPIHMALTIIYQLPNAESFGPMNNNELALRSYGLLTQNYIVKLKTQYKILNYLKQIDPIIGKKTIRALDFILYRNGK
jgi:hypothetical protein